MNSNNIFSKNTILWSLVALFILAGIVTLVYAFRSGAGNANTELDVVYTNAAQTVAAQQLTLQAGAPSGTPTLIVLNSPSPTVTAIASPTLGLAGVFSTATLGGSVSTCDNSVYLKDVTIPDGTTIAPSQAFTKTWQVSNTGTCTWSATYQIILISGDALSGKATAIGKVVAPGQSVEVSVAMTTPATTGSIKGTWRLQNDKSQPFGTVLTIDIKVGSTTTGTVSVTPTKTATGVGGVATAASTLTPSATVPAAATATPSNTPVPTDTPTITTTPGS